MKDDAEPPSRFRHPVFMIGQDSRGNWVVREQSGIRGGLFVDCAGALRYVRSENANRSQAVVMVTGVFELDMTERRKAAPPPQFRIDSQRERRVA